MRELAKKIIYKNLDMMTYFETDAEEVKQAVDDLEKELSELKADGIIMTILLSEVEDMEINEEIWNRFFGKVED